MKKIFTLLVLAMAATMAWATDVTFDFENNYQALFPGITGLSSASSTAGDFTETQTATVDYISITITPSTSTTPNRLWNGAGRLRLYGGTLTVSAPQGVKLTKIVFTVSQWNAKNTVSTGKAVMDSGSQRTWTPTEETNQMVLNVNGGTRIKTMVVTYEGQPNTAVNGIEADQQPQAVRYIDPAGRQSAQPFTGVNIVVTTLPDGTQRVTKALH